MPTVTVPVRGGDASEWVRGEQQLLPRQARRARRRRRAAQPREHRARLGAFRPRRDDPRPHLPHPPGRARGLRALGMRVLVPLAARRSHRIIAPSHEHARRPRRGCCGSPRGEGRRRAARASARRPRDAAAGRGDAARRHDARRPAVVLTVSAKRPHKNLLAAARRARADSGPSGGPCSCCRATRPRTRTSCSAHAARSACRRRRAAARLGPDRGARGPLPRARRASSSRRCTRASGCRCSRRWRAACRSPARTAARSPRWPATRRCCSTPSSPDAIAAAIERLLATRPRRERLARPAGRERGAVHWRRRRASDARELRARARRA